MEESEEEVGLSQGLMAIRPFVPLEEECGAPSLFLKGFQETYIVEIDESEWKQVYTIFPLIKNDILEAYPERREAFFKKSQKPLMNIINFISCF